MSLPATLDVPATRDEFLDAVRSAEVVVPAHVPRLEAAVPAHTASTADAARSLVTAGMLTNFQAERLLAGRTDGFHLGPYIIQEQVGRGVMGRVYKARHRTMNRAVAIKVLAAELTRTTADREAFQREVRAAAKLNHANIVIAYDANELDGRFYLVHEFVDGPNFETLVRERGPLPAADACDLIRQAALGLAHAHSHGMLHANLKPGNLLVTRATRGNPELVVKIADFGVPRPTGRRSDGPTMVSGNVDYVAPERAHNPHAADRRADLYSLGAVFFYLLTGRPLFPEGSAEEKIRQHIWSEPPRIDRLRSDVHPTVVALLHQLLAKHPQARPSSADEVAERLSGSHGAAGNAVCFDLPSPNEGPYSFACSQFSGGYAAPEMGPLSGRYPLPSSGGHPLPSTGSYPVASSTSVAASATETSPWEQISDPNSTSKKSRARSRRAHSLYPSWGLGALLSGVLLASAAAIGVLVKFVGK